jgi:MFS family permease
MMVGAYLWGSIADSVGRKKVLIIISFMNALCIVASSFTQSYGLFMTFRFLNGAAYVIKLYPKYIFTKKVFLQWFYLKDFTL